MKYFLLIRLDDNSLKTIPVKKGTKPNGKGRFIMAVEDPKIFLTNIDNHNKREWVKTNQISLIKSSKMQWDFSRFPKDQREKALSHLRKGDVGELVKLHNDYDLSENNYCCGEIGEVVTAWWMEAKKIWDNEDN